MDRSFLSRTEVIAASRKFVCIRLTTYENEAEARFLRTLFTGRSGDIENTTFTILAPDGKTRLVRAGRSTRHLFDDAAAMSAAMKTIAGRYTPRKAAMPALPLAGDVRLGLNIAAGDGQPLVVVLAGTDKARSALEKKVAALAWGDEFIGRFIYASATSAKELRHIAGARDGDAMLVVEPDTFGQKGKVVRRALASASPDRLAEAFRAALASHRKVWKDSRSHRAAGIEAGMFWETKLPVTDQQEAAARRRTRQMIERGR